MTAPTTTAAERRRKAAARRQRRYAQRRKRGSMLVRIEVGFALMDYLIESGLLEAWREQDRAAVQAAIGALVRQLAEQNDASGDGGSECGRNAESGEDHDR